MKSIYKLTLLLILCSIANSGYSIKQEDLSDNSFHRKVMEIARSEKLNVIINAPDVDIPQDLSTNGPGPINLEALAEKAGCAVVKKGDASVIVPRKDYNRLVTPVVRFFSSRNKPAKSIAENLRKELPGDSDIRFVAEDNLIVFFGEQEKTVEAEKLAEKLDTVPTVFRVSLKSIRKQRITIPDVSFLTSSAYPTTVEINDDSPKKIRLVVTAKEKSAGKIELLASIFEGSECEEHVGEIRSEFSAQTPEFSDFELLSDSGKFSGSWRIEIIDKPQTVTSTSHKNRKDVRVRKETSAEAGNMMHLTAIRETVAELCEKIIAAEGVNVACGDECRDEISLFCFGNELYFEELMNLVAKTANLTVRKIGNTLIFAPDNSLKDHYEMALFVTKKLQYANIEKAERFLRNFLEEAGMNSGKILFQAKGNNSLLFGGSGYGISALRNILELIDRFPKMLSLDLSSRAGNKNSLHRAVVASGKEIEQKLAAGQNTLKTSATPVIFAETEGVAVNYQCQYSSGGMTIGINGWTKLSSSISEIPIVSGGRDFVSDFSVNLRVTPVPSEDKENVAGFEGEEADQESSFDDAFDSSF